MQVCTSELGAAAKLQGEFDRRSVQLVALSCNDLESHKQWVRLVHHVASWHAGCGDYCNMRLPRDGVMPA
jgi:alkyl hydroperoxide reductase subunit AhpC